MATEVAAVCAALAALISALTGLAGIIISFQNGKKIDEVHKTTNGKMEQLLAITKTAAFAAGKKDEKDNPQEPKGIMR
jgi:hypothetical protein